MTLTKPAAYLLGALVLSAREGTDQSPSFKYHGAIINYTPKNHDVAPDVVKLLHDLNAETFSTIQNVLKSAQANEDVDANLRDALVSLSQPLEDIFTALGVHEDKDWPPNSCPKSEWLVALLSKF